MPKSRSRASGAAPAATLTLTCPHRPPCPGCPRWAEPGISGSALRWLDELAVTHHLPPVAVISGNPIAYRHRARLAIRGRLGSPKIGLFELDTHHVVHIPECRIQHPLINQVASVVRSALVDARISCYSDRAHLGLARYLQVVVERRSQSAQVVLVGNAPNSEAFRDALDLIRQRLGDRLHSLWFNSQTEATNVILGPRFECLEGPQSVIENFGGADIHYPPGAFGQNNLEIAERIIEHLRGLVPVGSRIVEFYGGVGAIGLSLLARASTLMLNEAAEPSLLGLAHGMTGLSADERARVQAIPGDAGQLFAAADQADVVIADPPRKGLEPALATYLSARPPPRLLYISCGLEAFRLDVERLCAPGRLRLASLTAFNLLPFTEHVETVAAFERVEAP